MSAGCDGEALGHLRSAALAVLARRAGREEAPEAEHAALWVHGELVPAGLLEAEEALVVTRTLLFAGAPEVPAGLAASVLADVSRMAASELVAS